MNYKEFESPHEWDRFCSYISEINRYVLDEHWKKFFNVILFTAKKREIILKNGVTLVRARIDSLDYEWKDSDGEPERYYGPLAQKEIGAPPPDKSKDGRINPRGISCLYLSTDIKTAISEVRPWLEQDVTVGCFEIIKDLKCIDASKDETRGPYFDIREAEGVTPKVNPETKEEYVWGGINGSFSRPVSAGDEHIHYIPTQYLSAHFKAAGYEGIIYKSALTKEGKNIVLFNPKNARLKGASLFRIKSIDYIYEKDGNPHSYKVSHLE